MFQTSIHFSNKTSQFVLILIFFTDFVRNQSMFGRIFVSIIDKFTNHIEIVVIFDLI